jgi:Arylsulfotransferase (ASST)
MHITKHPLRRGLRTPRATVGALVLVGALTAVAVETTALASTATAAPSSSPLTVLQSDGRLPSGDLFVTLGSTAEIVTLSGNVVWSTTAPAGDSYTDLRVQRYEGQPVVTFSVTGTATGPLGPSGGDTGTDYILNDHYQTIATVEPGTGYTFDAHEFWITPQGTAWITATQAGTANLTSLGGAADQTVTNGIAQEIDIKTGKVLVTWNSADHASYADSHAPLPASTSQAWDWFHINAVSPGPNGTILINSRHTWSTYDVNPRTGHVNWVLGGPASTFTQRAAPGQTLNSYGDLFAYEHDPQYIGHNRYWLFDDESAEQTSAGGFPANGLPYSRAVEVQINPVARTATVIASRDQPEGLTAFATGGVQPLPNGDLVVGWGTLPYVSIYDQAGKLIYNAEYNGGISSYRAYLFNWPPAPVGRRHNHQR